MQNPVIFNIFHSQIQVRFLNFTSYNNLDFSKNGFNPTDSSAYHMHLFSANKSHFNRSRNHRLRNCLSCRKIICLKSHSPFLKHLKMNLKTIDLIIFGMMQNFKADITRQLINSYFEDSGRPLSNLLIIFC